MTEEFDIAHDRARYAYEGRTNYGLVRAENGGIRMSEAHHSNGWEDGFMAGWDAANAGALKARIDHLLKGASDFRKAWNQWGDVNDLTSAEALEARAEQLRLSQDTKEE